MTQERPSSFEHTNLSEVTVSGFGDRPAIADGMYTLEVIKATLVDYITSETSKNPGQPGQGIDFQFAIVGDANFTGRRVFQPRMFPGKKTDEQLRLVCDATGIQQTQPGGDGVVRWLNDLVEGKARFDGPVENFIDSYGGQSRPKTRVVLWKASPASQG